MRLTRPLAVELGRLTHWGLRTIARRPASQLPGRVALMLDPDAIEGLAHKLSHGAIVVCGTNGKTTTNNLVASALEAAGACVLCNREGANMAAGVAGALLEGRKADWAAIEADELSLVHILPVLRPRYLVLLNLFRDQLDRSGEIDCVQDTIVKALTLTPSCTLVACADDPLSVGVALRAKEAGTHVLYFGLESADFRPADRGMEARFCQVCGAELEYGWRSYAQLGAFQCPVCSFARPALDFAAEDVSVSSAGVSFACRLRGYDQAVRVEAPFGGSYMVYNLLAALSVSMLAGVKPSTFLRALDAYDPHNGRLQHFMVDGREVILNLAKNPTGFNQNIDLMLADERAKAVLVVVNDAANDGRDISWIWDVDFERLAPAAQGASLVVFVSGNRMHDIQVRMKYAGVAREAPMVANAAEALGLLADESDERPLYVLCNYSALAPAREELERMERRS